MLSPARPSPFGQWHTNDDGCGALLFDATLAASPLVRDRLVSAVLEVRATAADGLVGTADLVADGNNLWLLADTPISPCLAELLAMSDDDSGAHGGECAVAVLIDIASTLSRLHLSSAAHGALALDSVVIDARGRALLADTGIDSALFGRTPVAVDDVRAWGAIARALGPAWARRDATLWRNIVAAAGVAEARGLEAATADLGALVSEADMTVARQHLAAHATPTPTPTDAGGEIPPALNQTEDSRSRTAGGVGIGAAAATQLGRGSHGILPTAPDRSPTLDRRAGGLRFGPGVPHSVPASFPTAATEAPARRTIRRNRRFRGAVLTLATIAAVAGWLWWRNGVALSVHDVVLTATVPTSSRCDLTVDVAADVRVAGTGLLSYQWVRNDGEMSAVLSHTVWPGQHDARVHLYWDFSGTGHYDGTVALKVLRPGVATGHTAFTYECP